ncbi:MAG TPA: DUF167 domain-containing protein [Bacillota bacterium]
MTGGGPSSDAAGRLPVAADAQGSRLWVWVRPRSARSGIAGVQDGALVVRVTAPPVDGRANREVCQVLAETFGLPLAAIQIVAGQRGRRKQVLLRGLAPQAVLARLEHLRAQAASP